MTTETVCHRRFPTALHLALGVAAVTALVLFLAGWGILFWVAAGATAVLAIAMVIQRLVAGPATGSSCERRSVPPDGA